MNDKEKFHEREYRNLIHRIEKNANEIYMDSKRLHFIGYPPVEPIPHFMITINHAPRGMVRRWIRKTLFLLNRKIGEPVCGIEFGFWEEGHVRRTYPLWKRFESERGFLKWKKFRKKWTEQRRKEDERRKRHKSDRSVEEATGRTECDQE